MIATNVLFTRAFGFQMNQAYFLVSFGHFFHFFGINTLLTHVVRSDPKERATKDEKDTADNDNLGKRFGVLRGQGHLKRKP